MYAIDVIPIARSARKESLTYLSEKKAILGSLIEVPLRKKVISALVLGCQDAEDLKSTIRKSSFRLRKAKRVSDNQALRKEFVRAIARTAEEFAVHAGQVLFSLTPKNILQTEFSWKKTKPEIRKKKRDWFVIQEKDSDRLREYRKIIRESFNKKQSVFVCVPSMQDGQRFFEFIKKGIEDYAFIFHSNISPKKLQNDWQKALEAEHPVIIIGTPMFLSIPRTDITRIIIDRESSEGYRTIGTPLIDTRIFIEYLAKEINAELIFSDSLLRLETIERYQQGLLKELTPVSFQKLTPVHATLFDMTEENAPLIFHQYPDRLIRLTKECNEHTFVFAARKGLASITVCRDCGHIVTTSNGSSPMTLYEHPDGNYFYSAHTKEKRPADEKCLYCGGWRLQPLGLGIDTIEKELKKIAPETKIFRLDKDSVPTHKKALAIAEEFYQTPGAILLGTEFASNYLNEDIDNIIITTIDSFLALADFQIQEKTLRSLLVLRSRATKNFVLQTRNPDQHLFDYAIKGNPKGFIETELASRKRFNFPPFSILIKITLQGPEQVIKLHAEEIVKYLNEAIAEIYPAHVSKVRGSEILNILLRVPKENWPNHTLVQKLQSLPPTYRVQVRPENIL